MTVTKAGMFEIQEKIFEYTRNKGKNNVRLLQIGSCDGVTHDPFYQSIVNMKWSGWLVEPVEYIYNQLKANYAFEEDLDLEFINTGIFSETKEVEFHYIRQNSDNLPYWYNQLGAFDKELILSHTDRIPQLADYIVTEKMPFVSMIDFLKQYKVSSVNVLHVDAMGFVDNPIMDFPFEDHSVELVLFESQYLSSERYAKVTNFLDNLGFHLLQNQEDTLGIISKGRFT